MSFQNVSESQIQGYNDCPSVDSLVGSRSSTAAARSKRNNRRLVHDLSASASATSIPSMTTPPQGPPLIRKTTESLLPQVSTQDEDVSAESLLGQINELLSKDSKLPSKELDHYKLKVKTFIDSDGISNLTGSQRCVIANALSSFEKPQKGKLMTLIMNNEGFGSWCLPLIKLLDNKAN